MNDGIFWLIPIVAIIGGITSAVVATVTRGRIRELEIRERIAMIERGLVPPPESDPRGFDRAMTHVDRYDSRRRRMPGRHRRAGITLIGVGFGLMVLIGSTADEPGVAFGVGGFLVILGIAFFVNGLFERMDPMPSSSRYMPSSAPPAPAPPPATASSHSDQRID